FTGTQTPGWTIIGGGANAQIFNTTYQELGTTFNAKAGVQSVDVSGTTNFSGQGLSQTVPTVSGVTYELSFYVGNPDGFNPITGAVFHLSIKGAPPVRFVNPDVTPAFINGKPFTVDFTATGSSTTLDFTYGSAPPNVVAALDNVSLNA